MVQRASELPRKGITEEQIRFNALAKKMIHCDDDQIVCLKCGSMFRNPIFGKYPDACKGCGIKFSSDDKCFMPDLVIEQGGKVGVVFIQQKWGKKAPHSKPKGKRKDEEQIAYCRSRGWKVFVVWNETINNTPDANLMYMIVGMERVLQDDYAYTVSVKDEKDELLLKI